MTESAVVNASPLIYLSRADLFDLLRLAGGRVLVPEPVAAELRARGSDDPAVKAMEGVEWLEVVESPPAPQSVLDWNLGIGESSVLARALFHGDCRAVIDDLHGRRCAEALGVPLRGTLGLVLRAKRSGRIDSARAAVERLRGAGMYLSRPLADRALAEVGE